MTEAFEYAGGELELFAHALRWKAYWARRMAPFVRGDVLEVGAGMGTNTARLVSLTAGTWTCLEPDARLCALAVEAHASLQSKARIAHRQGTLAELGAHESFDTIVYLDVLEHIEDDRAELALAAAHLRPGGRVLVLAPAHQRLYSPFDRAVGHFRRYARESLGALTPASLELERLEYLDSVGMLASFANRALLRQQVPTLAQIRTWDRLMVPISALLDPLLARRIGKSILAVWRR